MVGSGRAFWRQRWVFGWESDGGCRQSWVPRPVSASVKWAMCTYMPFSFAVMNIEKVSRKASPAHNACICGKIPREIPRGSLKPSWSSFSSLGQCSPFSAPPRWMLGVPSHAEPHFCGKGLGLGSRLP